MADERFSGDMSRNEVEIDLNKFMEMIQENNELKQKIFMLENEDKVNPWQRWIHLSAMIDAWRIFQGLFLVCIYSYFTMQLCGLWNYQTQHLNNQD